MAEEKFEQGIPSGFTLRGTLRTGGEIINRIAWSPDGKMLACSCRDEHIYIWDMTTGERKCTLPTEGINYSIAWSPDGRMLASSGSNKDLILWDTETGRLHSKRSTPARSIICVAWSSDGTTLAVGAGDGNIQFWDVASKTPRTLFKGSGKSVSSIAWSPNKLMLASGSQDHTVSIWSSESEHPLFLFTEHTDTVNSVVWSQDGKTLLSASDDNTIKIWDVEKKQLKDTFEGHTKPIVCLALSRDDQVIASKSLDGTIRLWETSTGNVLSVLREPAFSHGSYAGISFHPTMWCLATLGEEDTIIRIWDLDSTTLFDTTVPMIQYQSAKVVVVGGEDVGKTRLTYALAKQPYPSSDPTQGCSVQYLSKQEASNENGFIETREIYLWDLAGSHQYRPLHQIILEDAVLALIVFNAYSDPDDIEHFYLWDRLLRFAEQKRNLPQLRIKKFFVATRSDRKRRDRIPSYFDEVINTLHPDEYFITSAKGKGSGIEALIHAIKDAIPWEILPKISAIPLFAEVKNFLDNQKVRGEILSTLDDLYGGFLSSGLERVNNAESRAQFETCISQIETQGLIKKIHSGAFILLQPELLDYYASALIDAVLFDDSDGLGSILESKVLDGKFLIPPEGRLKDKELEKIIFIAMVRYLHHLEFVYRDNRNSRGYLFFPSLVTNKLFDAIDIQRKVCTFRFEGPVPNIYAKLVTRLLRSKHFEKREIGKDAIIFTSTERPPLDDPKGTCGIFLRTFKAGIGELTLSIDKYISDKTRWLLEDYIYTYLLSNALKDSVEREQIVICENCGEIFPSTMIAHRREKDFTKMKCSVCDTEFVLDTYNDTHLRTDELVISDIDREASRQRDAEILVTDLIAAIEERIKQRDYDEYVYYHPRDKEKVKEKIWDLMRQGIAARLDDDLSTPQRRQASREQQIVEYKAIRVFIGNEAFDREQQQRIDQMLDTNLRLGYPSIVVPLDDVPDTQVAYYRQKGVYLDDDTHKPSPESDPQVEVLTLDKVEKKTLNHTDDLLTEDQRVSQEQKASVKDQYEQDKAVNDEIAANRRISKEKSDKEEYDVFISYDTADREHVVTISRLLRDNGIAPWRYEWDAQPGLPEETILKQQIKNCKAAAVIMGESGIGPKQESRINALQRAWFSRTRPVIPVFLEKAPQEQELPSLMEEMTPVDFRLRDPDPLAQLIFGITGKRPTTVYRPGILVASLGESPVVISTMLRLLTERENLTIDQIVVLAPNDEDVQLAYRLVQEALTDGRELHLETLDFKDADSWSNACIFLQKLYRLLDHYEKQSETVYLSLAGGRKSMAALMAWIVPYFSCVRKLYHVIDKNEDLFVSSARLNILTASKRAELMNPRNLDQLILVDIPFENRQTIDNDLLVRMLSASPNTDDEIEALITERIITQEKTSLKVEVTKRVMEQFSALRKTHAEIAQAVRNKLLSLSNIETLREYEPNVEAYSHRIPKLGKLTFYRFTQGPVRPIFYTTPDDISPFTGSREVEKVIICSLDMANEHQTLKQVVAESNFPTRASSSIDVLLPVPIPAESVLIVPLGKLPMVATQLYTLLKHQEKRTIREVVLLYPEQAVEIDNAAKIIKEALLQEDGVLCTLAGVPELEDITTTEDCRKYQKRLEAEITRVQTEYPKCHIDLALSGGRKGMTAMTIFAAQRKGIPYVYHTLVTDDALSEEIDDQTTVRALKKTGMSQRERLDRLFLRAYQSEDLDNPYEKFVLFRVPIFSEQGQ